MNSLGWLRAIYDRLAILPRRLTVLSLAVMAGIMVASGYYLDQAWLQVVRDHQEAAWNQALGIADNFNSSVWQIDVGTNSVLGDQDADQDPVRLKAKLAEALRLMPAQLYALVPLDDRGRVILSPITTIRAGADFHNLDAFKAAAASRSVSTGAPISLGGEQLLPMVQPIGQGGLQGHAVLELVRLSYLHKKFLQAGLDPRDVTAVFEIGGPEILRSPAPPPGADLLDAGNKLSQLLDGAESISSFHTSGVDHISRLLVVMRAGGSRIGVLVAVPLAVLWQSWWPQAIWNIAFAVTLLTMMLVFHFTLAAELQRRRRAEAKAERLSTHYRLLAEHSSDALCEIKFEGGFRYVSPAMERLLGWTMEDLAGVDPRTLTHPDDCERMRFTERLTPEAGPQIARFRHRCKDGGYLWVEASIQLTFKNHIPDGFVTVMRDVTDRVEAERRLAEASTELGRLAATDELTGLANRRHFDQELDRDWQRAARDGVALSLLMLDIDFFKLYNDTYGHAGGDDVLQAVSAAIGSVLHRSADLAARWGGEEFAMLLPNTDVAGATEVAERVRIAVEELNIPHRGSRCGQLTVSVGVATAYPSVHLGAKPLVAEADANLYEAKRQGRNRVVAAPSVTAAVKFSQAVDLPEEAIEV